MMCNYGSSEYSQAFSRIGSLFGNVYIVNDELDFQEVKADEETNIKSIEINYNDLPINISAAESGGLILGYHYR